MENYQFFTLIGILSAGFAWIILQISDLKTRITVIETILSMQGFPVKNVKGKFEG